jgi:hypothetical protein
VSFEFIETKAAIRKKNQIVAQHMRLTEQLKDVEAVRNERERELQLKVIGAWPRIGARPKIIPTIVVHPPPEDLVEVP